MGPGAEQRSEGFGSQDAQECEDSGTGMGCAETACWNNNILETRRIVIEL